MQEGELDRARSEASIASAAKALGLALAPEAIARLQRYLELLQRWNAVYNLTAIRDSDAMRVQHVQDSLAAVLPVLRATADRQDPTVLDVGSGAGLPGIVLAVAAPGLAVTCADAVGKKAAFVSQAAGELGLSNLKSVHARVEHMTAAGFDLIVSRAFSSLADFTGLTRSLLNRNGVWVAMKGRHPAEEIERLPSTVEMFHVEQLTVPELEAARCLVWMRLRAEAGGAGLAMPPLQ